MGCDGLLFHMTAVAAMLLASFAIARWVHIFGNPSANAAVALAAFGVLLFAYFRWISRLGRANQRSKKEEHL